MTTAFLIISYEFNFRIIRLSFWQSNWVELSRWRLNREHGERELTFCANFVAVAVQSNFKVPTINWNDPHTNSMWCGDYNLSFKGRIPTATSSVHLGDGTSTDRGIPGIEFPGIEVRFRHQKGPHSPAGSSFRKEFVLLDTDPYAAREKVMSFRLRSFWPI